MADTTAKPPSNNDPAINTVDDSEPTDLDLTAAFANLPIPLRPTNPSVETCLAHLKLLFAFQALREEVGYTDGLFGLWDARVLAGGGQQGPGRDRERLERLGLVREKRWALYVARAVDRYATWWRTMPGGGGDGRVLGEGDMMMTAPPPPLGPPGGGGGDKRWYADFVNAACPGMWGARGLVPLGWCCFFSFVLLSPP